MTDEPSRERFDPVQSAIDEMVETAAAAWPDCIPAELGAEIAARTGRVVRAFLHALIDVDNPESQGVPATVVVPLCQQILAGEWNRLFSSPRENWG